VDVSVIIAADPVRQCSSQSQSRREFTTMVSFVVGMSILSPVISTIADMLQLH